MELDDLDDLEQEVGEVDPVVVVREAEEGHYQCRLCRQWIAVFPYGGRRVARWYAEMHCLSKHSENFIYQCTNQHCRQNRTKTWKALHSHQKQFHKGRTSWERVMSKEDEERVRDALLLQCFPHVPFPPKKRKPRRRRPQ